MSQELQSVDFKEKVDGSWEAIHGPSGRVVHGLTRDEAAEEMRKLLGMDESGEFGEPSTTDRFNGVARDIAEHLEGPVSEMLSLHSGYARLEGYADGIASVRLGGGCQGCPSSLMTLANGVLNDLQHKFGEEVVMDIQPVLE